jgi:hypothetical protein
MIAPCPLAEEREDQDIDPGARRAPAPAGSLADPTTANEIASLVWCLWCDCDGGESSVAFDAN